MFLVAVLGAAATLGGCDSGGAEPAVDPPVASQPAAPDDAGLAGVGLYVDPTAPAVAEVDRWLADGRDEDAAQLRKISEQPMAVWVLSDTASVGDQVDAVLSQAETTGTMPVLVAYHITDRDCGGFSGGGAATADEYRGWIRAFADVVRGRPVTVILEPDAVAHTLDACADDDDRLGLLADAVTVLKDTGSARVYLDASHPGWVTDLPRLADALRQAGIEDADGFALNVSNFISTPDNVSYGHKLSDELGGGTKFVIDTSRNGLGPAEGDTANGGPSWCNPPGRALGEAPTTEPGLDRVDALLWIKRPGESDGDCRPGEPAAGQWWPEYALELARRAG